MTEQRPMLYPLADALEMEFRITKDGLEGTRKTAIELFEGYSPTICSTILESLTDFEYGVIGIYMQIWGNLHVAIINEDQYKQLTLFVVDRSKMAKRVVFPPNTKWSRKRAYAALGGGTVAIYHRGSYDDDWKRMENAVARLKKYNSDRVENRPARESFNDFWGVKS